MKFEISTFETEIKIEIEFESLSLKPNLRSSITRRGFVYDFHQNFRNGVPIFKADIKFEINTFETEIKIEIESESLSLKPNSRSIE